MTIDERLEALVGGHEALAQSVELLAGMQKVTEAEQKKTMVKIRKWMAEKKSLGAQLVAKRYEKMTAEERTEAARNAAKKRWAKTKKNAAGKKAGK